MEFNEIVLTRSLISFVTCITSISLPADIWGFPCATLSNCTDIKIGTFVAFKERLVRARCIFVTCTMFYTIGNEMEFNKSIEASIIGFCQIKDMLFYPNQGHVILCEGKLLSISDGIKISIATFFVASLIFIMTG